MGRKEGGCCAPFTGWGSWFPVQHNVAWDKVYYHTKWRLHPSTCLATIDMGQKLGAVPLLGGGGALLPHVTQRRLGRGLPPYQVAS